VKLNLQAVCSPEGTRQIRKSWDKSLMKQDKISAPIIQFFMIESSVFWDTQMNLHVQRLFFFLGNEEINGNLPCLFQ
jgi:hypothetical protein